jgi:hypothetical protein
LFCAVFFLLLFFFAYISFLRLAFLNNIIWKKGDVGGSVCNPFHWREDLSITLFSFSFSYLQTLFVYYQYMYINQLIMTADPSTRTASGRISFYCKGADWRCGVRGSCTVQKNGWCRGKSQKVKSLSHTSCSLFPWILKRLCWLVTQPPPICQNGWADWDSVHWHFPNLTEV